MSGAKVSTNIRQERGARISTAAINDGPVPFGGHNIKLSTFETHVLISAKTGAGKSQLLLPFLNYLTNLSDIDPKTVLVVTDAGGVYTSKFYNPEKDVIFNPYDSRSHDWSPLAEVREKADCAVIADIIAPPPQNAQGQAAEWRKYAVDLVTDTIDALTFKIKMGEGSDTESKFKSLLKVMENKPEDFEWAKNLLAGTASSSLYPSVDYKFRQDILSTASGTMRGIRLLNPNGEWSIRKWLSDAVTQKTDKRILWIPYRSKDRESLGPMIGGILSLIIKESLSLEEDRDRHIFIISDELSSLGTVPALETGLTEGRKYGLCIVAAIQTLSQLEERYGNLGSRTILGNFNSKVVLGQADGETAEYFSGVLGEQDFVVTTDSVSTSRSGAPWEFDKKSSSVSRSEQRERGIRLLPKGTLIALPDMNGFAFFDKYSTSLNGQIIFKVRYGLSFFRTVASRFCGQDVEDKFVVDETLPLASRFIQVSKKAKEVQNITYKKMKKWEIAAGITLFAVVVGMLFVSLGKLEKHDNTTKEHVYSATKNKAVVTPHKNKKEVLQTGLSISADEPFDSSMRLAIAPEVKKAVVGTGFKVSKKGPWLLSVNLQNASYAIEPTPGPSGQVMGRLHLSAIFDLSGPGGISKSKKIVLSDMESSPYRAIPINTENDLRKSLHSFLASNFATYKHKFINKTRKQ
jgi:hypothetical protein